MYVYDAVDSTRAVGLAAYTRSSAQRVRADSSYLHGAPVASDRTLAHGIYHRHIQNAPAEQGWMERAQLLDWANIQSTKFLEAAYNAKLLDCAIDMASKVEVYRVLNPAKMLAFTLEWKERHQDKKAKKVK